MKLRNFCAGVFATVLLLGCSGADEEAAKQAEAEPAEVDHVWKEQVETIDRAKGVEDTIKAADEAKRKAMEDDGGG